ncbi:unnamed protein product [Linum trigynum]|uniref:Uncharacterized protein n=1 Tax=Linum trigynum TaxID=586398 RepID=A0AAV2FDF0_9ROSI
MSGRRTEGVETRKDLACKPLSPNLPLAVIYRSASIATPIHPDSAIEGQEGEEGRCCGEDRASVVVDVPFCALQVLSGPRHAFFLGCRRRPLLCLNPRRPSSRRIRQRKKGLAAE